MSNFGPIHKLIVREVGEPYDPLSTQEFTDYEIEHPPECKLDETGEVYSNCGVAFNVDHAGVRWLLRYSHTPITEPGEYRIQAWAETHRGFDYTEYDGGIVLVEGEQ